MIVKNLAIILSTEQSNYCSSWAARARSRNRPLKGSRGHAIQAQTQIMSVCLPQWTQRNYGGNKVQEGTQTFRRYNDRKLFWPHSLKKITQWSCRGPEARSYRQCNCAVNALPPSMTMPFKPATATGVRAGSTYWTKQNPLLRAMSSLFLNK